jgi:hypothetical protein
MDGRAFILSLWLEQLLPTLEALGFHCPTYYNPADFVVKLSSRRLTDEVRTDIVQTHVQKRHRAGEAAHEPAGYTQS